MCNSFVNFLNELTALVHVNVHFESSVEDIIYGYSLFIYFYIMSFVIVGGVSFNVFFVTFALIK